MNSKTFAPPRAKFTAAEDALIVDVASKMTEVDWKTVAEILGTRTARQCRERYRNYLSPDVCNKDWTPSDDKLLEEQFQIYGPQWAKIRNSFSGKSCVNIKNRWAKIRANKQRCAKQVQRKGAYVVPEIKASDEVKLDEEAFGSLALISNNELFFGWDIDFFNVNNSCF